MTDLELRYRRLLALLPWEHRRRYEDEMLGVLLAARARANAARCPRTPPTCCLALGVMAVHRREERMRLLDVGRAAERESRPAEA